MFDKPEPIYAREHDDDEILWRQIGNEYEPDRDSGWRGPKGARVQVYFDGVLGKWFTRAQMDAQKK